MPPKKDIKVQDAERSRDEEDDEFLSTRARRFLIASTLVRDACVSRLQINYKRDLPSVKLYERFYSKGALTTYYILTAVNLLSILAEYPASILVNHKFEIAYYYPLIINLVCESYFYYRWYQINKMSEKRKGLNNLLTKVTLGILLLMTADAVLLIICHSIPGAVPVRWTRFLRPVLLLTFPENRRLRAAFNSLRHTVIDVMPLFALMVTTITLVSVVAVNTLSAQRLTYPDGTPYFRNFLDVFWDFYVLTTSANSPDVIIPAYEQNRMYIWIYVIVCVMCNWLFMSILVACVYNSYRRHLGDFVVRSVAKQKLRLDEAFNMVATRMPNGEYGISLGTFMRLMRIAKPGRSDDALRAIFHVLNVSRSGYLDDLEFARLSQYIRVKLEEIELSRQNFEKFLPKFPSLYSMPQFKFFQNTVQHPICAGFFIALVFGNAITCILLFRLPSIQSGVEWFFSLIFVLELMAKYLACGGVGYFNDGWNKFDFCVVSVAFFSQLLQAFLEALGIVLPRGITQMLLLLRLVRLLKFLSAVKEFRAIVENVLIIGPSLMTYGVIMMIFYYMFTCFALEVYQYRYEPVQADNYTKAATCYNPRLEGTDYVRMHYCLFNFNSPTEAFIMLFAISVGNNWHLLSDGTVRTTLNTSRIFFLLVHWICVLMVLNVVLAFIIEAYLLEHRDPRRNFEGYIRTRLQELGVDAPVELAKRGLGDYAKVGFHLTPKQLNNAFPPNSPTVKVFKMRNDVMSLEVLMFQMFQREIEELVEERKKKLIEHATPKAHEPYM